MTVHHLTRPEMVTTGAALKRLADRLASERLLACDLEADSLHHYQERVCLIQISTPGGSSVIDPLAISDLSPLAPLMANEQIKKVFHGADYDIRSLHRDFGMEVCNLFDTMVACQLLGEKEVGLAAVLKNRFGVELDKKYQKADWSKRPLSAGMVEYAVMDTTLLLDLYQQLEGELTAKGRLYWLEEECEILSRVRQSPRSEGPFFLRFKGAVKMDSRTLAVLEELLSLREEKARMRDVPPFKILGNEQLRQLAEKKPRKVADISSISGMGTAAERYGNELIEAVARGLSLSSDKLPHYPRPRRIVRERQQEERLQGLKLWREKKAGELGVDAGVLINNSVLEALSETVPHSIEDLAAVPLLKSWQKREFGAEFIEALEKS